MPSLFAVLGWYGIIFGVCMLPTGLFVGPHILAVSLVHILIGTLCVIVSCNLKRRQRWAYWCGVILSFAILLISGVALFDSLREHDLPGIVFYSLFVVFLSTLFITSVTTRSRYVGPT